MTELKRATEAPDFVVDEDAGALLNTNEKGLMAYRRQREEVRKSQAMYARVHNLESELSQIKDLLIKALNK